MAIAVCMMIITFSVRLGHFIFLRTCPGGYFCLSPSQLLHFVFQQDLASGLPYTSELQHCKLSSMCIPLNPWMCFWPLYFDSVFFSTLSLKWIFWKSSDSEKVQSSMFTFGCRTCHALWPVAFQRGQSPLLFWKRRLLGKVWMKMVKTNGLPPGPDGFNAMRNANLLVCF